MFPDPDGRDLLARASGRLSFQAGEFSATYGAVGGPFEGTFDAVVTSFFVDTAPNVVEVRAGVILMGGGGGVEEVERSTKSAAENRRPGYNLTHMYCTVLVRCISIYRRGEGRGV